MKTTQVVVSRHKENLDWLKNCTHKYIVYNKGNNDIQEINTNNIINIANIDTEAYSYIQYIVDHYDSLPEQIIFTQANPFDHSPSFLTLINEKIEKFNNVQPLSCYYNKYIPLLKIRQISFPYTNIDNIPIHIDFYDEYLRTIFKKNIFLDQGKLYVYRYLKSFFQNQDIRKSIMDFIEIIPRTFNNKNITPFCYSSIFSVNKEKIHRYNKNFYWNLHNKCRSLHQDPSIDRRIFGWIMEYGWMELFQYEPPPELYILD